MRIWHFGAARSPQAIDGVNKTIWVVARQQAAMGHDVTLVLDSPPDTAALDVAAKENITVEHVPSAGVWRYDSHVLSRLLHDHAPQVVHMHSMFLPRQATVALELARHKLPYIITPHGGLHARRGRLKNRFYGWLIERPRFLASSAVTVVTPKEETALREFLPDYDGVVRWVPNPVDATDLGDASWPGASAIAAKNVVFLGRFDVQVKGIDILIAIARHIPDVAFHLYGTEDPKTRDWLNQLKRRLPSNVHFHNPVFGAAKSQVLADASLYIQTSRREGFPISVAEAMYIGTPCAVSAPLNFADLFRQEDLGLLFLVDPADAAARIANALAHPEQLLRWSDRARAFAHENFAPRAVAQGYLRLYEEVLSAVPADNSASLPVTAAHVSH